MTDDFITADRKHFGLLIVIFNVIFTLMGSGFTAFDHRSYRDRVLIVMKIRKY